VVSHYTLSSKWRERDLWRTSVGTEVLNSYFAVIGVVLALRLVDLYFYWIMINNIFFFSILIQYINYKKIIIHYYYILFILFTFYFDFYKKSCATNTHVNSISCSRGLSLHFQLQIALKRSLDDVGWEAVVFWLDWAWGCLGIAACWLITFIDLGLRIYFFIQFLYNEFTCIFITLSAIKCFEVLLGVCGLRFMSTLWLRWLCIRVYRIILVFKD
jgi:hypothetical protein